MARYDKNRAPRRLQKNQEIKSDLVNTIQDPTPETSKTDQIQLADETNIEIVSDPIQTIHWIPDNGESIGQKFHIQTERNEHQLEVCTCYSIIYLIRVFQLCTTKIKYVIFSRIRQKISRCSPHHL
jgi:hypothetical protein